MTNETTCLKCGAPLACDARQGFCPKCLFAQASAGEFDNASVASQPGSANPLPARESSSTVHASASTTAGTPLPRAFGDYELLEEVARGGMGIVYRARHLSLDRIVAVKMLLFGPLSSPEFVKRFRAEASAAASLQHPNIVAIHEVGVHQGQQYFAMDYVEGQSLAKLLANGPLPARSAASYLKTIAEAIHYAHERGILHRDLKPSNVLIDASNQPRVTDFGLARRLEGDSELTVTGQVLGSPNYMPPEQAAGRRGKVSRRSDVYSLGAMLYHLVTGRPPFVGDSLADTLEQVLNAEPVSPRLLNPSVPRDLETICLKCLEKEQDKRYATAQALADEVARFVSHEPIQARPVSSPERAWRWCRRKPALASFVIATALLLLAILIGSPIATYRIRQAQKAERVQLKRAEAGEYASDMKVADQAVQEGDYFTALQVLDRHRPQNNSDLRGWEWRRLWQQCQPDQLFILGVHSNGVSAVGFLPDGKTAFSAGKDKTVRLWDLTSRKQIGLLPHDYPVTGAACSPDGRWLVTSSETLGGRGPLGIWDLKTQQELAILSTNFSVRPRSIVFSPDRTLLAFADNDDRVRLWRLFPFPRQEITNLEARFQYIGSLGIAFSPDGKTLAYNENKDGDIVLWDIPSRSVIKPLRGHSRYVTSLAFTPDGQLLISGSMDKTVKLWSMPEGIERTTFRNFKVGVGGFSMSLDGTMLATAGSLGYQRMTVQEIPSGREILTIHGHQKQLTDAAFSPDGRSFITGSEDETVRVWDVTGRPKRSLNVAALTDLSTLSGGSGTAVCLTPDGEQLLTVFNDKTFTIWETRTLTESQHYPVPVAEFSCAALASGGKLAAFFDANGRTVFWHGDTGRTNALAKPVSGGSTRALFSADGERLAIGGFRDVRVMNVIRQEMLGSFSLEADESPHLPDLVMSLAFSSNNQRIAAGFFYGLVKVWDLSGGHKVTTFKGDTRQVHGLAFLPDGRTLVSASRGLRFWDLNSGRLSSSHEDSGIIWGCSLSPDGRRLAAGGSDALKVWDLASQQVVATLLGHEQPVLAVAFLADGNTLISVGDDQVRVWRAASFAETDREMLKK